MKFEYLISLFINLFFGPKGFFHYRHVFFYNIKFDGRLNKPKLKGFKIRYLRASEKNEIMNYLHPAFHYVFDGNYYCSVIEMGGNIVCYHLFKPLIMRNKCFFLDVRLDKDELFTVSAYTDKNYRNLGILTYLSLWSYRKFLQSKEFTYNSMIVDNKNIPVQKVIKRCGGKFMGHIKFIVIFNRFKIFLRNDVPHKVSFSKYKVL